MSDNPDTTPLLDFEEARHRRRHELDEQRLMRMREAFVKALPLPTTKVHKKKGTGKKGKKR